MIVTHYNNINMETETFINKMFNSELDNQTESCKQLLCGICGENHSLKECHILKITNHIPDKTIPSKARLTLPDNLEIRKLCDGTYNVYSQCLIEKGTQFGPFQAKKLFTLYPSINFPLKIFTNRDEDLSEYFLDTTNENECSWMMFIGAACNMDEQNIICYQDGENLYYGTIKDIHPGESLKVWYSPYYAAKMNRVLLNTTEIEDNFVEKKSMDIESILRKKKNVMPRDSWSCKFCGKVEKELSVFAHHLLDHYKAQASKKCAICKDFFHTHNLLKKHLKIVHKNDIKQPEIVKENKITITKVNEQVIRDTSLGGPLLLNNISTDSLDNSSLLLPQADLLHLDLHGMDNENMIIENENLNLNVDHIINENVKQLDHFNFELNELESEQLICDICLKSFEKLKLLIKHIEQHTGKFVCQQCNTVFARNENLMHHACNVFYKIKCPLCEKIFFQKKYLTQHLKAFHKKEYTCIKCNKFYDSRQNLLTHVCPKTPMHKKEKFPCTECSKIFFNKKNLYEHTVRHKRSKLSMTLTCEICNAKLRSRKTYLNHMKVHEGCSYTCDICNKSFTRTDSLKDHKVQMHNVEVKLETCEVCKKTFKTRKLLRKHSTMHSNDRPHVCEICNASFKSRNNLNKHKKKHIPVQSKLNSLFVDQTEFYSCPKCNKMMKLKSSLLRHLRTLHPDAEISLDILKPKLGKLDKKKVGFTETEEESVMDLKETIDNMNFNTDEVNNCSENNDINMEIDKILNNAENIDTFLNDSSDQIVENLISIAAKENQLSNEGITYAPKEVCLSMPDLTTDQEIKLGENAYILDNGTIVEPQESSSKVVVYILDQNKFP